jgi:four helix bundle protein
MIEENNRKEEFKRRIKAYIIRLVSFLSSLPRGPVIKEILSQLMRSGTSIGANYYEASAASSKKDFQNYFNHSLKSANETKFWLSVLIDTKLVPSDLSADAVWLLQESTELANIFAASILTMKGKK